MNLAAAPPPLTPRQRQLFWLLTIVCAATRFLATARSLWEWDEALFSLGMRAYDVTMHHPHPPGFPVYIAAAKIVRLIAPSDFRALQALNLTAGVLLFPAMFLLGRELRLRYETAIVAASLCAFFPNVLFFGGTAFSDVPSLTLVVFAVAMYLRGCRDANAYLIATFLLAISIGIRPQNLLVGLVPGAIATWHRARASVRDVVFAALLGISVAGIAYGSAVVASGSASRYIEAIRAHGEYISRVDSFRAPGRPGLWRLFDRFFFKQYQSPALSAITTLFVLISAAGAIRNRDRRIGLIVTTFAPFAIAALLMLDRFSVTRFSIGYCPMFAVMAADGIARAVRQRADLELVAGGALAAAFFAWTLPALTPVRRELSPPVLAIQAVQQRIDPKRDHLFVGFSMIPFIEYFTPYVPFQRVLDERAMPLSIGRRRAWLLAEIDSTKPHGLVFARERDRLWNIARRHYFEVALEPMATVAEFGAGWYGPERSGADEWRWMSRHSVTLLPPASGDTELRVQYDVPAELIAQLAKVTATLNGRPLERFQSGQPYVVTPARNGAKNVLEIDIDRSVPPQRGGDPRELGLRVTALSWGPA